MDRTVFRIETSRLSHFLCFTLLLVTGAFYGCGRDPGEEGYPGGGARGRTDYERIAAMAPAVAEMIESLDRLELVVAVGDFVQWPPAVTELPRIGAYATPNIEQLLRLDIDLLITARSEAGVEVHDRLRSLGIDVMALELETYEGTLRSLIEVGEAVGRRARAEKLVGDIRASIDAVRSKVEDVEPRRVLVVVGTRPLYAAGPGSHIDELIEAAGGVNIFADALSSYQMVSIEAAVQRRPDVIIDVSDNRPGALRGRTAGGWSQWTFLPAVRENRVYYLDPVRITIPGPRLPEMAELMGRMIHPEVFGDLSPEAFGPMERYDP